MRIALGDDQTDRTPLQLDLTTSGILTNFFPKLNSPVITELR